MPWNYFEVAKQPPTSSNPSQTGSNLSPTSSNPPPTSSNPTPTSSNPSQTSSNPTFLIRSETPPFLQIFSRRWFEATKFWRISKNFIHFFVGVSSKIKLWGTGSGWVKNYVFGRRHFLQWIIFIVFLQSSKCLPRVFGKIFTKVKFLPERIELFAFFVFFVFFHLGLIFVKNVSTIFYAEVPKSRLVPCTEE